MFALLACVCVHVLEEQDEDIKRRKYFDKHEIFTIVVFVLLLPKILVKYKVRNKINDLVIVYCVCAVFHLQGSLIHANCVASTFNTLAYIFRRKNFLPYGNMQHSIQRACISCKYVC